MARLARIGPHIGPILHTSGLQGPFLLVKSEWFDPLPFFDKNVSPVDTPGICEKDICWKVGIPRLDRFETPGSHESQMLSRVAWGWCDLSDLSMSQKIGTTKSAGSVLCFTGIVIFQLEFMGWSWSPIDTVQIRWHVEVLLIDFVHTLKFLGLLLRP